MSKQSKKEPQYIKNYASDGKTLPGIAPRIGLSRNMRPCSKTFRSPLLKKPVAPGDEPEPENEVKQLTPKHSLLLKGPGPRMGLSRNVRPSPNAFKSPMLKQSPKYPNYIETTPTTPQSQEDKPDEIETNTPKEKPISRINNRKKAKKNLQQDFEDQDDVDSELKESSEQSQSKTKQKINAVKTGSKDSCDDVVKTNENETNVEGVNNKVVDIDTLIKSPLIDHDQNHMEDCTERRSVRARVVHNPFVDTVKEDGPKGKKSEKPKKESKKLAESENLSEKLDVKDAKVCGENKVVEKGKKRKAEDGDKTKEMKPKPKDAEGKKFASVGEVVRNDGSKILIIQDMPGRNIKKGIIKVVPLKEKLVSSTSISTDSEEEIPLSRLKAQPLVLNNKKVKRLSLSLKHRVSSTLSDDTPEDSKEIARKELRELEGTIGESLQKLRVIRNTLVNVGSDTEQTKMLTKRWETGCKQALIALHQYMTSKGSNIDMDTLLKRFKVPEDIFKFDSFEYAFV